MVFFFTICSVIAKDPIKSILSLVSSFICVAILMISIDSYFNEFISFIMLIIYSGAVVILFLLTIMMIGRYHYPMNRWRNVYTIVSLLICFVIMSIYLKAENSLEFINKENNIGDNLDLIYKLSDMLYNKNYFAFEILGLLLLVAAVGSIMLLIDNNSDLYVKKRKILSQG
jgi:NADH-quinone oxidoreductase subunit J